MKIDNYKWLRWIAVLPSAILGYLLVYGLLKLVVLLSLWLNVNSKNAPFLWEYTLPAIASGFGSYFFIYFGAWVAPSFKKTTSLILLIIMSLAMGISVLALIKEFNIALLLEIIGNLIGIVVGYKKNENEYFD